MNLNEERKAPLRGKDLSTKREMVVQYISTTAKSVSCCCKRMVFLYYISVMKLMGFLHFIVTNGLLSPSVVVVSGLKNMTFYTIKTLQNNGIMSLT